jgi:two-component system catabolic regulation response regulator CreB
MEKSKIIIVEDEGAIAESLLFMLSADGFDTLWLQEGRKTFAALDEFKPDLIILDVGLPDMNGFDVCRQVRTKSSVPVLFLTARNEEIDRILGLELGADDYVTKPFSAREVVARVRAILRRMQPAPGPEPAAEQRPSSDLVHDQGRCLISYKGKPLPLSRYEYRILSLLMQRPGWVFSRDKLMELVWETPEMSLDRTVDTHIKTLRAKIREIDSAADLIVTHRGFGYSLREKR